MEQTKLDTYLKTLSLHKIREIYLSEVESAARTKLSYQDYLSRIVEQQVLSKIEGSVNRKMQITSFPQIKRLEEFDFSYQPKLNEKLIRELAALDFLNTAKNIIFVGAPGVGKTHLAISIGIKAASAMKRVLFYTAEKLTEELASAEISGQLNKKLDTLSRIDLLIIDELGYLSLSKQTSRLFFQMISNLSKQTSRLFFQMISKRYEKGSVIVTSNKPFEEWGEIFNDETVAAAILDRLLHHSYPFLINGKSFRLKSMIKSD